MNYTHPHLSIDSTANSAQPESGRQGAVSEQNPDSGPFEVEEDPFEDALFAE